ncbi:hypothetical protein KVR01_007283 [Diaporthe batatas]|uniref:uncharacterized protein n=1 Tax=Diaporthe batatas TaxID=748121 RepID=UPI001D04FBD4|nr:uncharacterized protein KVR01_007283 [Diaporthe batatas]KAG8162805.1 hypothetical protein KVR01_007283 [Diaporthe batatas]
MAAATLIGRVTHGMGRNAKKTASRNDNKVSNTSFDQKIVCDGDGVYQFLYRIFALPPEVRELVWRFACDGRPTIRLGGSETNGIISVMLALKDQQFRSEGLVGVWKSFHVEWEGTLESGAWKMFKKAIIPHIRCLTINFLLTQEFLHDDQSEMRKTIAWVRKSGKSGHRTRHTWHLEQLHLVGVVTLGARFQLGDSDWYMLASNPVLGRGHWSQHGALNNLRDDGLELIVETRHEPTILPLGLFDPELSG